MGHVQNRMGIDAEQDIFPFFMTKQTGDRIARVTTLGEVS